MAETKITKQTLLDKYFLGQGVKRYKHGSSDDCTALLPMIVLDLMYQEYCTYIKPLKLSHNLKHISKRWSTLYHNYNKDYFKAFSSEEVDYIIDKMDSIGEYLKNDITIARVHAMSCLADYEIEDRKVIAAAMICNIFSQAAGTFWKLVMDTTLYNTKFDPNINGIEAMSRMFIDEYYKLISHNSSVVVNPNNNKNLNDAVSKLCKNIVKFMYVEWKD